MDTLSRCLPDALIYGFFGFFDAVDMKIGPGFFAHMIGQVDAGFPGKCLENIRDDMQQGYRGTKTVSDAAGVADRMAGRIGKIGCIQDFLNRRNHRLVHSSSVGWEVQ